MTIAEALALGAARLTEAGIRGASRDVQRMLTKIMGLSVLNLTMETDRELTAAQEALLEEALERRVGREPVSKIIGEREFWGRSFIVTRDVLDPRPETETLIAAVLDGGPVDRLLDLGTGSGVIAVTLLAERQRAHAVAADLSVAALHVARRNAQAHDVEDRIEFRHSDWYSKVEGEFDLIVSNPPYIAEEEMAGLAPEVLNHDPTMALTPGPDVMGAYRAIAQGVKGHLAPGGRILVEIGPTQADQVRELFEEAGLERIRVHRDMDGRDRVVAARRSEL